MDPKILAQLVGALLRWGSLGKLGSKTVRKEVRKIIEGVQTVDDARAGAIARAKREILEEMGAYLQRLSAVRSGQVPAGNTVALSSGLTHSEVVKEKPFTSGDRQGIRIVVKGKVAQVNLDGRARKLLADRMRLERLKASEQRDAALLERHESLEAENSRLAGRGSAAKKKALRAEFRDNSRKLTAQEWHAKLEALWNGIEYTDAKQAIEYINKAIELVPDYPVYYFFRGNANYYWKQYPPALRDFDTAIRLDPRYAEAFNNRGNTYYRQRQYPRAIQDYDAAVRFNSHYADAFNNRGNSFYQQKQFPRAIEEYDKAIRLDEGNAIYYNNRGISHDGLEQRAQALEDYAEAIRRDPDYAVAFYNRGLTYAVLEQHERAIADYQQAIRLDPKNADAYYSRGRSYEKRGYKGAARRDWRKASKLGHLRAKESMRKLG